MSMMAILFFVGACFLVALYFALLWRDRAVVYRRDYRESDMSALRYSKELTTEYAKHRETRRQLFAVLRYVGGKKGFKRYAELKCAELGFGRDEAVVTSNSGPTTEVKVECGAEQGIKE